MLLVTTHVNKWLKNDLHWIALGAALEWDINRNYRQLSVYQISTNGLVHLSTLPFGTEANAVPQFLPNDLIIYQPSHEYVSTGDVHGAHVPHYSSFVFDQLKTTEENNREQLYLYNPFKNRYEMLPTRLSPRSGFEFSVLPNGDIFSTVYHAPTRTITLTPDPTLKMMLAEQNQENAIIDQALAPEIVSAPVRRLIMDYAQSNFFRMQRIPNRFLSDDKEESLNAKIQALIAKNEKVLNDIDNAVKESKKEGSKERTLTSSEKSNQDKAKQCIECLRRSQEIIAPRTLTFKECADIIWKEFIDIPKHGKGIRSLISGPFKEVYDLIESSKKLDVANENIIKPK